MHTKERLLTKNKSNESLTKINHLITVPKFVHIFEIVVHLILDRHKGESADLEPPAPFQHLF